VSRAVAAALLSAAVLAGCSDDGAGLDYSAEREAPPRSTFPTQNSDTFPSPEDGIAEAEHESGATVVIWIDPDDIRKVYEQHSDPDDDTAWTAPQLLYRAGDGCLDVSVDTEGGVLAATLDCYHHDAFRQQAPTTGQAVVTEDLETWVVEDKGELWGDPHVAGDGSVSWDDSDLTWSPEDGFNR
jgi:hypothetical protein